MKKLLAVAAMSLFVFSATSALAAAPAPSGAKPAVAANSIKTDPKEKVAKKKIHKLEKIKKTEKADKVEKAAPAQAK